MPFKDYMILHLEDIDYRAEQAAKGYSVGGTIYFQIDDIYFPAEHLYDIVSHDLSDWLPKLVSFAYCHTDSCELSFLDGPYQVRLQRQPNSSVTVICAEEQKIVVSSTEIDFSGFMRSVVKCIRKYHRMIHEMGGAAQFNRELSKLKELTTIE